MPSNPTTASKRRNFAFMKASEGVTFTDGCFDRNWRQSRAVHIPRGAYDFAHPAPDTATARAEAGAALRAISAPRVLQTRVLIGTRRPASLDRSR